MPITVPPVVPRPDQLTEQFITSPERLDIHDIRKCQQLLPREVDYLSLLSTEHVPYPLTLHMDRDPNSGVIVGVSEVRDTHNNTGSNSDADQPPHKLPCGLQALLQPAPSIELARKLQKFDLNEDTELLRVAPGMSRGLDLFDSSDDVIKNRPISDDSAGVQPMGNTSDGDQPISARQIVEDIGYNWVWQKQTPPTDTPSPDSPDTAQKDEKSDGETDEFESLLKAQEVSVPILVTSGGDDDKQSRTRRTNWAQQVDTRQSVDNFHQLVPNMAMRFKFELDTFQKQAVVHMEQGHSVFVAAHTSAGKTVVAEYAIAMSQRNGTKAVYTSPIKALSNQKFGDFRRTFPDVGLLTGDTQINETASCLICTTEILRSMLYNNSHVIRDLEWVIFDEIHYINDPERGVVWEETLIMLPDTVGIVMLSATVPNCLEFADWIGRIKKRQVYVISTLKRPVPLQHFLYTGQGGKSRHDITMIVDTRGQFSLPAYKRACELKEDAMRKPAARPSTASTRGRGAGGGQQHQWKRGGGAAGRGRGTGGATSNTGVQQDRTVWTGLVDHLSTRQLLPAVVFSLKRSACESLAGCLGSSTQLLSAGESGAVRSFTAGCLHRLSEIDRKLPQVVRMCELLERGIGIHHSGVLPILKEIVEQLFQTGFVKILFATETFAMGVNMPARTVVFNHINKFDGVTKRTLNPSEYIQMAGRAGRRGHDSTGTVIILCRDNVPPSHLLQTMMLGRAEKLTSQFRITYTMILNLLRARELRIQDIIGCSFGSVPHQMAKESSTKMLEKLEVELKATPRPQPDINCPTIDQFYNTCKKYLQHLDGAQAEFFESKEGARSLCVGRVIVVSTGHPLSRRLALVLQVIGRSARKCTQSERDQSQKQQPHESSLSCVVLILCVDADELASLQSTPTGDNHDAVEAMSWRMRQTVCGTVLRPPPQTTGGSDGGSGCLHTAVTVSCADIHCLLDRTVNAVDGPRVLDDIKRRQLPRFSSDPPSAACSHALRSLIALSDSYPLDCEPLQLTAAHDLPLTDRQIGCRRLREQLSQFQDPHAASFAQTLETVCRYRMLTERVWALRHTLSDDSITMLPDYQQRLAVLRELGYVDSSDILTLKGRVGCGIGSRELLVTELLFHDVLTAQSPPLIAATLSTLVFEDRSQNKPDLSGELHEAGKQLNAAAERIDRCQQTHNVLGSEMMCERMINIGLMEVVYEWARGMAFADVVRLTDVQEGIIVRCIRRLDETLRDVRSAARVVGNTSLHERAAAASEAIRRNVVFAASLYTAESGPVPRADPSVIHTAAAPP